VSTSPPSPEVIRDALREVLCPGTRRDIVSIDLVGRIAVAQDRVTVEVVRTSERPELIAQVRDLVARKVGSLPGVGEVEVPVLETAGPPAGQGHGGHAHGGHGHGGHDHAGQAAGHAHGGAPDPWGDRKPMPGVAHVVAVASAKGGVGKSSVAVNLALALRERGLRVGLLDADVYGPSVPLMLDLQGDPEVTEDNRLVPLQKHGLQVMSIGFWLDPEQPVIWRGPMVFSQVRQFLHQVAWDELDALVVDLPPGTGDAQLTLLQQVPVTGVVMVTTPQEIALADVRRGITMFRNLKFEVPVLGIVENMSWFECPDNGKRYPIFGSGGGAAVAQRFGVPLLAQIPIEPTIREGGDAGTPAMLNPVSPAREAFLTLADRVAQALGA
jgi:ATP-binding protein involved in chromosome partitioning